jgi:hypothetical protein
MAAKKGFKVLMKAMLEKDVGEHDLKGYPVKGAKYSRVWESDPEGRISFFMIEGCIASIIVGKKGHVHQNIGTALGLGVVSAKLGAILLAAEANGEQDLLGLARHVAPKRVAQIDKLPKESLVKHLDSKICDLRILSRELIKEIIT